MRVFDFRQAQVVKWGDGNERTGELFSRRIGTCVYSKGNKSIRKFQTTDFPDDFCQMLVASKNEPACAAVTEALFSKLRRYLPKRASDALRGLASQLPCQRNHPAIVVSGVNFSIALGLRPSRPLHACARVPP
jgi:hypothetical protein